MIAARWEDEARVGPLRDVWQRRAFVRCEPFLPEATAIACLHALRAADYRADHRFDSGASYQLWRYGWLPCDACDTHPLCALGRWLWRSGSAFISDLTKRQLHARRDELLLADMTRKGSFFDTYDDAALGASIALQLHFTTASWPNDWGGYVERVPADDAEEPWTPVWNAMDIIDLERGSTLRGMPLATRHVEGLTISAWLFRS